MAELKPRSKYARWGGARTATEHEAMKNAGFSSYTSYEQSLARQAQARGPTQQQQLAQDYQNQYNEARASNIQRYEQILTGKEGYGERLAEGRSTIEGLGAGQRSRIEEEYGAPGQELRGKVGGAMYGNLVSRGLAGTSEMTNVARGVARARGQETLDLEDRLSREKMDYVQGLQKDRLDFMERREDEYPSLEMLTSLSQGLGQYGAGGGGAGAGGGGGARATSGFNINLIKGRELGGGYFGTAIPSQPRKEYQLATGQYTTRVPSSSNYREYAMMNAGGGAPQVSSLGFQAPSIQQPQYGTQGGPQAAYRPRYGGARTAAQPPAARASQPVPPMQAEPMVRTSDKDRAALKQWLAPISQRHAQSGGLAGYKFRNQML